MRRRTQTEQTGLDPDLGFEVSSLAALEMCPVSEPIPQLAIS